MRIYNAVKAWLLAFDGSKGDLPEGGHWATIGAQEGHKTIKDPWIGKRTVSTGKHGGLRVYIDKDGNILAGMGNNVQTGKKGVIQNIKDFKDPNKLKEWKDGFKNGFKKTEEKLKGTDPVHVESLRDNFEAMLNEFGRFQDMSTDDKFDYLLKLNEKTTYEGWPTGSGHVFAHNVFNWRKNVEEIISDCDMPEKDKNEFGERLNGLVDMVMPSVWKYAVARKLFNRDEIPAKLVPFLGAGLNNSWKFRNSTESEFEIGMNSLSDEILKAIEEERQKKQEEEKRNKRSEFIKKLGLKSVPDDRFSERDIDSINRDFPGGAEILAEKDLADRLETLGENLFNVVIDFSRPSNRCIFREAKKIIDGLPKNLKSDYNERILGALKKALMEEISLRIEESGKVYTYMSPHSDNSENMERELLKVIYSAKKYQAEQQGSPINPMKNFNPDSISGITKGSEMTKDEADFGKANPRFLESGIYHVNCQTCVVAFIARLRGYKVIATGNTEKPDSVNYKVSCNCLLPWIDPETGENPTGWLHPKKLCRTPKSYHAFLSKTMAPGEWYTMQFPWKGNKYAHIICAHKNDKGEVEFIDPQRPASSGYKASVISGESDIISYLKEIKLYHAHRHSKGLSQMIELLRVDNLCFNPEYMNDLMIGG